MSRERESRYVLDGDKVQVREYQSLFAETRTDDTPTDEPAVISHDDGEPAVKQCPQCGMRYSESQMADLLDFTGDDTKCVDCEGVELIDAEDRSGSGQPDDDPDIS
ncbi:MAG TPA: hypothetical protein VFN26_11620 [Candidatus Acidoferrum sp.]|nr:hypothetical protein [Candidatus Acidoferrum sp.]